MNTLTIDGTHLPRHNVIEHLSREGIWPLESDDMQQGLNDMTDDQLIERFRFVTQEGGDL